MAALSALVVAVALLGAGLVAWKWRDAVAAESGTREQRDVARRRGEELEKSLGQTKRALYVSNVLLADRYWREGRFEQARDLLARCDRRMRDWEWHYLHRQLHPAPERWFPDSACKGVAISSDGRTLAAYRSHVLNVWNARSGEHSSTSAIQTTQSSPPWRSRPTASAWPAGRISITSLLNLVSCACAT